MSDLTDIHTTVRQALPTDLVNAYPQYITPVVEALIRREEAIITQLRTIAASFGLADNDTERVLVEAGLIQPEPATSLPSMADLDEMRRTLDALTEQVRKAGGTA